MRLERTLSYLKDEFRECGSEYKETKSSELAEDLHALTGAINEIELFMYGKKITTIMDCI